MMGRAKREPDLSTYSGRVAARIRELRSGKGWSVDDLHVRLKRRGVVIPVQTLYSYERGKDAGGANIPLDLIPVFGKLFGSDTPSGWLP